MQTTYSYYTVGVRENGVNILKSIDERTISDGDHADEKDRVDSTEARVIHCRGAGELVMGEHSTEWECIIMLKRWGRYSIGMKMQLLVPSGWIGIGRNAIDKRCVNEQTVQRI
ncbi:hypothetical protein Tco_1337048 [Tanacetum coccineum]